jgi:uncharacterized membrane protein YciS (DUF1049 family)
MFGEWEEDPADETQKSKTRLEVEESINRILKEREQLELDELARRKKTADIEGNKMKSMIAQRDLLREYAKIQEQAATAEGDAQVAAEKRQGQILTALKSIGIEAEEAAGKLEELEEATDEVAQAGADAGEKFFGGIAAKMGMASTVGGDFITKLNVMRDKMSDPKFAANFTAKFREIFTLSNMASAGLMAVAQASIMLATQADKATAAFAKQTGTGTTFRASITNLSAEYRELGVTTEDASKAIGALFTKMPGYTEMAAGQQREFERTVVTLEKLGVAVEDSTTLMSDLMKGQKMSAEAAMQQTQELALMAESLQMTAGGFVKEFNEARKVLAVYGKDSVKVFKNIASAAQAAGVETSALLDMAGKFDEFGSAAETAGKLNAIMGASVLSATDMITTSEDKRIETLIRSMQAQGIAFKDMDKFTQKAIAQTLGIQDLNQAQKILGMDVAGFRNYQAKAASAAKEQEEMEKKAKAAMDAMQKLKMAFANLATQLLPLITAFQTFAQLVLDVSENMGGGDTLAYIAGFLLLGKVLGPLLGIFKFFGIGFKFFTAGTAAAGTAATAATAPIGGLAAAMGGVSLSMLGMALAIGIVMVLFIILIGTLVDAGAHGMHAGAALLLVAASVYVLSAALGVLGTIGAVGGFILAGLIALFVAMSLATAKAGEGIAAAFEQLNNFISGGGSISKVAKALNELGDAFRNLNVGMKGGGLIQKGLAFVGIGGGAPKKSPLAQMAEDMQPILDKADSLAAVFSGIEKVLNLSGDTKGNIFTEMAAGLNEISAIVDKESEKGMQIQHTLENIALIKTGKSAGAGGFGGVIKAITGMSKDMTVVLKLDAKQTKELLSKYGVEAIAKAV